eukprot:jgi/Mesvir1/18145/Mv09443-RA.1
MLSGTANVGKKALGWVRGSVGACASGIGKTLTREQIERLVVTLYKELPAAFIKKTPTPTLCILVGDEVVGRLLMNMCKQALQGSPDAHERLVHIAFMLTKTSKDVLFRIPKEYLCEIISRATNTTQRVAMLQNTFDFNKKFGNEDFRDLGMRAGRAFANEAGDGPYDMGGGRGGGGKGGMPMFVNNVYPRGPIRRGNAGGGGNAAVYFNAPPNQNPWTHYGGQARTAHQAACCQVVQSAVNNAHRMRAESIAGALNPYTKVGKTEEPSPGVPGSSKDGNALRGDKVFGPGYLWGGLFNDEPSGAGPTAPPVVLDEEKKITTEVVKSIVGEAKAPEVETALGHIYDELSKRDMPQEVLEDKFHTKGGPKQHRVRGTKRKRSPSPAPSQLSGFWDPLVAARANYENNSYDTGRHMELTTQELRKAVRQQEADEMSEGISPSQLTEGTQWYTAKPTFSSTDKEREEDAQSKVHYDRPRTRH